MKGRTNKFLLPSIFPKRFAREKRPTYITSVAQIKKCVESLVSRRVIVGSVPRPASGHTQT